MHLRKYNYKSHKSSDLVEIFGNLFEQEFNTVLIGGAAEPVYLPAKQSGESHRIFFTQDYFASALHEVAHWCAAGERRRLLEDYGYWYAPDGRTQSQQMAFEKVEVKPQAMEWHFSVACGAAFRVSADNLDQGLGPSDAFTLAIADQARHYALEGLPARAGKFCEALCQFYGVDFPLTLASFNLAEIQAGSTPSDPGSLRADG